jgi:hypothetical protein
MDDETFICDHCNVHYGRKATLTRHQNSPTKACLQIRLDKLTTKPEAVAVAVSVADAKPSTVTPVVYDLVTALQTLERRCLRIEADTVKTREVKNAESALICDSFPVELFDTFMLHVANKPVTEDVFTATADRRLKRLTGMDRNYQIRMVSRARTLTLVELHNEIAFTKIYLDYVTARADLLAFSEKSPMSKQIDTYLIARIKHLRKSG